MTNHFLQVQLKAKVSILCGLLMGAVTLKATKPITNVTKTPNQKPTEIVSKEGAVALKETSLQGVQQSSVPSVHNMKLETMYKKYADNPDEIKLVNTIVNDFYNKYGTFLASARIQHELDRQQLFVLLQEDNKTLERVNPNLAEEVKENGPQFYKSVTPNAGDVTKWLEKEYSPVLVQLLTFEHKPTANEVTDRINYIVDKKAGFKVEDLIDYHTEVDWYKNKYVKNKTDVMTMSDFIALQIYTLDKIMIKKSLTNCNFFGKDSHFDNYSGLSVYYDDWMETVSPMKKKD